MTDVDGLVHVELLRLPVPLWSASQQLFDELLREFALASAQADDDDYHHVPGRLTRLMDDLVTRFAAVTSAQEEALHAAAAAGLPVVDRLVFTVPAGAARASIELGDLLDDADLYCREGKHLLTLAAPDDVVAFRRWYLGAFASQIAGARPVPWPEFDGSWPPAASSGTRTGAPS